MLAKTPLPIEPDYGDPVTLEELDRLFRQEMEAIKAQDKEAIQRLLKREEETFHKKVANSTAASFNAIYGTNLTGAHITSMQRIHDAMYDALRTE